MHRYIALQKIVETGSFTKAADVLGYTQPAISQFISSLEKELGVKLLYRSRGGIRLTVEGERLFPSICETVTRYRSMKEIAKQIVGLDLGTIRIGTLSSISCHWLPGLIRDFRKQYKNVEFVLHQGDNNSIPEWIRTGEIDFGFVNLDVLPNTAGTVFLKEGEYRAVIPKQHRLAGAGYVTLQEMAKEPFLVIEEGTLSRPLEEMRRLGLDPEATIRVHDDYTIMAMVEAGLGVSILPELVLRKTGYDVEIKQIRPALTRGIGLLAKDKAELPLASKYFIDHLIEHLGELP